MNTAQPKRFVQANAAVHGLRVRPRGWEFLCFVGFSALGALAILYRDTAILLLAIAVALGLSWWAVKRLRRIGLQSWQVLLLFALTCNLILNYGFDNIAIHFGGLPFVVSYALMYTCLAMALYQNRQLLPGALKEPAMVCILILLFLSSLHLILDIPASGVWAFRDATLFLDGLFFVLGLLWAAADKDLRVWLRWMMVVFIINLVYAYTFPWRDRVLSASPTSGVFMQVEIFGQYHATPLNLLMGTAFCMGLARLLINSHRWVLHILVALQLLGLAILQARSAYVSLAAYLLIFILLREGKKTRTLLTMASLALAGITLMTALGIELSGRIGPVNLAFLEDHIRSISGAKVTAASSVESRVELAKDVMGHIRAHPIVGEGFGKPLVDYIDEETGAAVRVPHNSHLTVMARLGIVGFIAWLAFNGCLIFRFAYAYHHRKSWDARFGEFALWSFLYYVAFMVHSLVEGPLEKPSTAIPFYFFVGLAVGVIRLRMVADSRKNPRNVGSVNNMRAWSITGEIE